MTSDFWLILCTGIIEEILYGLLQHVRQRRQRLRDLSGRGAEAFRRGRKALEKGDWAAYGRAMGELERLLNDMSGGRRPPD